MLLAQRRRVAGGHAHLAEGAHVPRAAQAHVRATEAPACHHQVGDVARIQAAERNIIVGPAIKKIRVVGIQSFCVLPDYRGTGLSNKMMSVVLEEGSRRGFDAGLLFCREQLLKVYGHMGWNKFDASVYITNDKKGKTLMSGFTMFYPLNARQLPTGDIDLAGNDW